MHLHRQSPGTPLPLLVRHQLWRSFMRQRRRQAGARLPTGVSDRIQPGVRPCCVGFSDHEVLHCQSNAERNGRSGGPLLRVAEWVCRPTRKQVLRTHDRGDGRPPSLWVSRWRRGEARGMCGARVLFRSGDRSRRRIGSARRGWSARRGRCPYAPFGTFAQGTRHHVAGGRHDLARGSGRLDGLRLRGRFTCPAATKSAARLARASSAGRTTRAGTGEAAGDLAANRSTLPIGSRSHLRR